MRSRSRMFGPQPSAYWTAGHDSKLIRPSHALSVFRSLVCRSPGGWEGVPSFLGRNWLCSIRCCWRWPESTVHSWKSIPLFFLQYQKQAILGSPLLRKQWNLLTGHDTQSFSFCTKGSGSKVKGTLALKQLVPLSYLGCLTSLRYRWV